MEQGISINTPFYGDNLAIMREYISDGIIDLVYLDPPFDSNRNDNALFDDESGRAWGIRGLGTRAALGAGLGRGGISRV